MPYMSLMREIQLKLRRSGEQFMNIGFRIQDMEYLTIDECIARMNEITVDIEKANRLLQTTIIDERDRIKESNAQIRANQQ